MKHKKALLVAIKSMLSVGAIVYVGYKMPAFTLVQLIGQAHSGWMLCALVLFGMSKIASAYRVQRFLAYAGIPLPAMANLKLYWLGMFYNQFLPGGVGGDVFKAYKIHRELGANAWKVGKILLLDRISGLVVLIVILLVCASLLLPVLWVAPCVLAAISGYVAYLFSNSSAGFRIHEKAKTELYSWLVQTAQFLSAFCLIRSLGVSEAYLPYLVLFMLSSVVSVVPLSLGGLGMREFTFLVGAEWLGLPIEQSVGVGFLFYTIGLFCAIGGVVYVWSPPSLSPANTYPLISKTI